MTITKYCWCYIKIRLVLDVFAFSTFEHRSWSWSLILSCKAGFVVLQASWRVEKDTWWFSLRFTTSRNYFSIPWYPELYRYLILHHPHSTFRCTVKRSAKTNSDFSIRSFPAFGLFSCTKIWHSMSSLKHERGIMAIVSPTGIFCSLIIVREPTIFATWKAPSFCVSKVPETGIIVVILSLIFSCWDFIA